MVNVFVYMTDLPSHTDTFRKLLRKVFDGHCESGLCTLAFHLLGHLTKDVDRFGTLQLQSSAFEKCNVHVKSAYRSNVEVTFVSCK